MKRLSTPQTPLVEVWSTKREEVFSRVDLIVLLGDGLPWMVNRRSEATVHERDLDFIVTSECLSPPRYQRMNPGRLGSLRKTKGLL